MSGCFALQVRLTLLFMLVLGGVLAYTTHPVQTAVTTALLIPEAIPDAPLRPLLTFSDEPVREHVRYPYQGGQAEADVFLPAKDGRYGAVILFLGINADMSNPHLLRISQALARSGIVALVPTPVELLEGRVSYSEIDALAGAFDYLLSHPKVDAQKVGLFGFSVGASLVLVAAADPRINEQVAFVNAFGGYFSAESLFLAMTTRQIQVDGLPQPWEPNRDALVWFAQQFIHEVDDEFSRGLLEKAFVSGETLGLFDILALSLEGKAVFAALSNRDPQVAAFVFQALPGSLKEQLARLSPQNALGGIKTDVYVMHDRNDTYIPFTESRRLVEALKDYPRLRYSEFDLFQHVEPTKALASPEFVQEIWKLFTHAYYVVGEVK